MILTLTWEKLVDFAVTCPHGLKTIHCRKMKCVQGYTSKALLSLKQNPMTRCNFPESIFSLSYSFISLGVDLRELPWATGTQKQYCHLSVMPAMVFDRWFGNSLYKINCLETATGAYPSPSSS